ncbi:hypothetical protein BKA63DRAFT_527602 [Paraphoma chrysanthemicola]|nr:hypothetical protein BKA63DRAFT_528385 [Paraphoma chrysanthemicola]KAH7061823.1 hypothetical protein BKA63DRAFT_527602 [Paraphoma chrysanthemicola]
MICNLRLRADPTSRLCQTLVMAVLHPALPRELRDYIYELVLTFPTGLNFSTGDDGISRICDRSGGDSLQDALATGKNFGRLSSIRSAVGTILSLVQRGRQMKSFNQIQYVNRAFYRETFGLEFRYNSIVFEDGRRIGAAQRCQIFVNKVEGRAFANELRLCIVGSHLSLRREFKDQALTLLEFCARHPTATVRWHDPHWSSRDPKFILLGLAYTTALRGDRDVLRKLMHDTSPLLKFDMSDVCPALPKMIPWNYRILPAERQPSRASLIESCEKCAVLVGTDISQWVQLAEQWFKEGV